jgi:NADH:ubiquinone oxidoreductase subunit F (NADH-binding)
MYARPDDGSWASLPLLNEIPFFAKQMKINLENCGVIDPESIDQYLARGGYTALSKVLNGSSRRKR